jgi:transposase
MDLETGFILWAGLGRSMADFEHFFKSIGLSLLSRLKAVAMDMNASFNRLFQKYCPKVPIVYDRYHMQAQFGRDVMGAVRLEEAQKHRQEAEALKEYTKETNNPELQKMAREKSHEERKLYTELKKSRWILLKEPKYKYVGIL